LFVDDAHGIGTLGETGAGTGQEQNCQDSIDIYFGTFAKSFGLIGGFISSDEQVVEYLRYNMRSQIFAKAMPMPLVIGALKRLELMRNHPEYKTKLWEITNALQNGLKDAGFDIGPTGSCVTPVYMNGSIPESTNLIYDLRENFNLFCSMVVYPVVPKGMIILRLIPTAVHTLEDVQYTIECFSKIVGKLKAGEYMSDKIASV
jgi:glycine C-acetyltransferase